MSFRNLKITTKIIICCAALLIPLALLLGITLQDSVSNELEHIHEQFSRVADRNERFSQNARTFDGLRKEIRSVTTSVEESMAQREKRRIPLVILTLVCVGASLALAAYCIWDIRQSSEALRKLFSALEKNDLTAETSIRSRDEFGTMMIGLRDFLAKLREAFNSFREDASTVAGSVYDLSASAKEITTTANEQSASVSEIVSTMESSKELSEQMAAKTQEVAELAKTTQDLSRRGAELREINQDMMQDIRDQNTKIIDEIKNLTDMIQRINEAIAIIDGIADQTKLIAFNASLEASSSGEAGARFSVVASEIRRFADNVVDSTDEIKQKIEEVQGASQTLITEALEGSRQIDENYERMAEQKAVFEGIVEKSENVASRSEQISNLSKQQEYASSQIFATLKEISAGVKQFVTATASTSKIADNLNGLSDQLEKTLMSFKIKGE